MYKKLKKILNFPTLFTFKIICFNKKDIIKNINCILKKKKIFITNKRIKLSKEKKYLSYEIIIKTGNFNEIKYIYKKVSCLKFVKIIF
jgi:putative lipoic acid-binding regulatory protein